MENKRYLRSFLPIFQSKFHGLYSEGPNKQGGPFTFWGFWETPAPYLDLLFIYLFIFESRFQHFFYMCPKYVEMDVFMVFLGVSEAKMA